MRSSLPKWRNSIPIQPKLIPDKPTQTLIPDVKLSFSETEENLVSKMREFGVADSKARSLIKSHREAVEREISVFPHRLLGGAIKNVSGLFIKAVEESYETPQSYLDSLKEIESKNDLKPSVKSAKKKTRKKGKKQNIGDEQTND